jgi:hypothetical protein
MIDSDVSWVRDVPVNAIDNASPQELRIQIGEARRRLCECIEPMHVSRSFIRQILGAVSLLAECEQMALDLERRSKA